MRLASVCKHELGLRTLFSTMQKLSIAAAQLQSIAGNIEANILTHKRYIDIAAQKNADFIIFPELSLTGYEPEVADRLQLTVDDRRLNVFKELAHDCKITIAVGAPMVSSEGTKPTIASFIFTPEKCEVYTKHYLHPGEEFYFSSANTECAIHVHGMMIGMAICADLSHPEHAQQAAEKGCGLYAAGVFITENGYAADTALLRQYTKKHGMAAIMANYSSSTGRLKPAGKSAIWNERGELIVSAQGTEEALVIAKRVENNWSGHIVRI